MKDLRTLKFQISCCQGRLNKLLDSPSKVNTQEILKLSQDLDVLITEYYKLALKLVQ